MPYVNVKRGLFEPLEKPLKSLDRHHPCFQKDKRETQNLSELQMDPANEAQGHLTSTDFSREDGPCPWS